MLVHMTREAVRSPKTRRRLLQRVLQRRRRSSSNINIRCVRVAVRRDLWRERDRPTTWRRRLRQRSSRTSARRP